MKWSHNSRDTINMEYIALGQTGLVVSQIGFGAWGIGGGTLAYGPTDDQESRIALRRAYDLGVTFYDTADIYGNGHSECLIGDTLKDVRRNVIIATKVGFSEASQDFSPEYIKQSLEASLKRLQTDYIDLYQLHCPSIDALGEDSLSVLRTLKEEGKVRTAGISVRSPDDGLVAATKYEFKVLQVNFNLVDQRALNNGLFALCEKNGVGIIVRTPLCFGFLTEAYSPESHFDSSDHRSRWSSEQRKRWATSYKYFSSALGKNGEQTHAQIALRFCLSYRSVSTVIPGMLTKEQVEENAFASQMGPFSKEELQEIERIYQDNAFFVS